MRFPYWGWPKMQQVIYKCHRNACICVRRCTYDGERESNKIIVASQWLDAHRNHQTHKHTQCLLILDPVGCFLPCNFFRSGNNQLALGRFSLSLSRSLLSPLFPLPLSHTLSRSLTPFISFTFFSFSSLPT